MTQQTTKRYWGSSIGEGGKYVPQARHGNFIAIGWDELGNLQSWEQRCDEDLRKLQEEFRTFYREHLPGETVIQSGINAGQVWNFVVGMKPGDIALVREPPTRKIHIAEVTAGYKYVETPDDGCRYQHRRLVRWIREDVDREELPERLKTSLGSLLTIFNLDKHHDTIEQLIGNAPPVKGQPVTVTGERLVHTVLACLSGLDPYKFQDFISDLFSLEGFSTSVTQYVGDRGVDVVGALSAGGLAEISLKIQVKRIRSNVGIKEVLQLRGTLATDEHGASVTLGRYTKQAITEAQEPGKKEIMLIDGEALVDLILKHYEELPLDYKEFLGLRRREIPLRDQFTASTETGAQP